MPNSNGTAISFTQNMYFATNLLPFTNKNGTLGSPSKIWDTVYSARYIAESDSGYTGGEFRINRASGLSISLAVGNSNNRGGLYNHTSEKWIAYCEDDGINYFNGYQLNANIEADNSSANYLTYYKTNNSIGKAYESATSYVKFNNGSMTLTGINDTNTLSSSTLLIKGITVAEQIIANKGSIIVLADTTNKASISIKNADSTASKQLNHFYVGMPSLGEIGSNFNNSKANPFQLVLGNAIAANYSGNSMGEIHLYGKSNSRIKVYYGGEQTSANGGDNSAWFPNVSGQVIVGSRSTANYYTGTDELPLRAGHIHFRQGATSNGWAQLTPYVYVG